MSLSVRNALRACARLFERTLGLRAARTVSTAPGAVPSRAQATEGFLPRGDRVRGGWPMPPDFADRFDSAWWNALQELYARPHAWPGSVAPETGLLLHALVRNIRPSTIVETGTCHGASTIWMASALAASGNDGCVLHTFDLFELPEDSNLRRMPLFRNQAQQVRDRIAMAGLAGIVSVHQGDSSMGICKLGESVRRVELAYLDGDHSLDGIAADFQAVDPLIPAGGYVLLHDVFPDLCGWTGPRKLIDHLHQWTTARYQTCDFYTAPNNFGLTVMRKLRASEG